MAEERLIDDDKDRKYKIRKNADGEDELVIDDLPEEEEEATEEVSFEVPELDSDDEEAAVMTPEQLAAREKARIQAEEKRHEDIVSHAAHAKALIAEGKYEDALYVLDEAEGLGRSGEISALKLQALTRGYTDFSKTEECTDAADGVLNFAEESVKAEHAPYLVQIEAKKKSLKKQVDELNARNEEQKSKRRTEFSAKKKKSLIWFAATAIPMLIFAVLAIYFGSVMHAREDYLNMILFIVFISCAGVCFVATLFTAHKLWEAARLISLNAKNSSTKLGREYEAKRAELTLLDKITEAYKL